MNELKYRAVEAPGISTMNLTKLSLFVTLQLPQTSLDLFHTASVTS